MAYAQKAIDMALTADVFPVVQKEELTAIDDVVYRKKTSGYYTRRGHYEGIGDPYNIVIKGGAAQNGIMAIVNETLPNKYLNGIGGDLATTDKNLPYLIEYGRSEVGDSGYDYWIEDVRARPFTATTIKRLQASGAHRDALKTGLIKRGIAVR